jgi:bacteriorhodopsin
MKCTILFGLIASAAAGDPQQSSANDAPAQQSYGNNDPVQQSYGNEVESYGAAPAYVATAPACCVSVCPHEAPFFNPSTCACHAGMYVSDNNGIASYAGEHYYGGEEQSGYRKLDVSQPDGTIDTRGNVITRGGTIVLWIVFALFFLLGSYYIRMSSYYSSIARAEVNHEFALDKNHDEAILHFLASPALVAGLVTFIASLAYLTMATGNGWYIRCHDGRMFFFARYIDWVITTPLMLHALCHFGGAGSEIRNFLFFSDVVMIIAGLIASTITGVEKWIFFAFSMLAFIPIMYYICKIRDQIVDNLSYHSSTGERVAATDANAVHRPHVWFFGNYRILADLTVVTWLLYPVAWILAEGTSKISVTSEAIFYAVLDFIAKGVFGWLIVNSSYFGKEGVNQYTNILASKDWK